MVKNYDQKPTSSASATHSDERILVVKLTKSGGCVDRDAAFMKALQDAQIRTYFFGNALSSTASPSMYSLSGSSTSNGITLSPHTQQLDYRSLTLYNYASGADSLAEDEDEEEYDPARLTTSADFPLPSTEPSSGTADETLLQKLPSPGPIPQLSNTLIAITHAAPNAPLNEIRDASIMGFIYVADVDAEKSRLRVLAPLVGRIPAKALVWGKKWPGEVIGLVG